MLTNCFDFRYKGNRLEIIIFINGRLVECPSIKKLVETIYTEHLPSKSHPFVYLSLEMPQRFVDVNVHPTKESVEFLNERAIIERIGQELKDKLDATHKSKSHGVSMEITKTVQPLQLEEPKKVLKPNAGPKRSNISLDSVKALRTKLDENNNPELQVLFDYIEAKILLLKPISSYRKCFLLTLMLGATGQKMLFLFNIPLSFA